MNGIFCLISNCSVQGTISGSGNYVGGLIGSGRAPTFRDITVNAVVSGDSNIGGIVGGISNGGIQNCSSKGTVTGTGNFVGGIVGNSLAAISTARSSANVSGQNDIGGLVGYNGGQQSNCYARGTATGNDGVGGLCGYAARDAGGTITNCYSTGLVTGVSGTGGLIGLRSFPAPAVNNCFWDTQTSGQASSSGGTGKTTTQMKTKTTFTAAGWDFATIWAMSSTYNNGYPNLDGVNTNVLGDINIDQSIYQNISRVER
jgi:hypothetical protein